MTHTAGKYVASILATIGALLLGMGLWLSYQHHLLVSAGVEVQATVTHKEAKGRPGAQAYSAQLVPEDQPQQSIKVRMTEAQFAAAEEGQRITFTYVVSDPDIHMIGGLAQARDLETRDQSSVLAGLLALAAAAASYGYARRRGKRSRSRKR